jgi:hypothetical protein
MFAPELRRVVRAFTGSDLIAHTGSDTYISDSQESAWNKYSPAYHDVFPDAESDGYSLGTRRYAVASRSTLARR